jgi:hypothetical protein
MVHNYPDCIRIGRDLLGMRSVDPRLRAEGSLVAGYALVQTKEYIAALDVLEEGVALLEAMKEPVAPQVGSPRSDYDEIAQSVVKLGYQKESDARVRAITALRRRQLDTKTQLDNLVAAADRATHDDALWQRQQTLKTDVMFVLAEATKKAATERAVEYRQRLQQKTQQFDQKIEQLKQEMKQIK